MKKFGLFLLWSLCILTAFGCLCAGISKVHQWNFKDGMVDIGVSAYLFYFSWEYFQDWKNI